MDDPRTQRWLRRAFVACVLFAFVMALLPRPPALPGAPGDKVQHMIAFATLGCLAAAGWRDKPVIVLFAWLAVFGAAIELFQAIPALHRDADWVDWLADMAAAAIALFAVRQVLDWPR
ncbi:hypothetical protein GRI40_04445 [Altererythrobacter aerius]|uniref:VanZ family protein n=1 Tax=Tsuneonella aeria TaxID=1837929 RepID=A0A6I4TB66_9SPHN|nr:hypothetical protein [Tsuneonella aeria]